MTTIHFRRGKDTVVLAEQPNVTIPVLIAALAEVLVSSQLATQEQVAELRLATRRDQEWTEISHSTDSLQDLNISDSTIIAYAFGPEAQFAYEDYVLRSDNI